MPDFFICNRKKNRRGGGVIPKFLVCTQNILLRGGGGELCQIFLYVPEKKLGGGEGVYPNFWCVLKNIIVGGGGGGGNYAQFFLCILGRGGCTQIFGM